jgi:cation diffusion facilitator CzcD-associated flavoprotein CzcO
MIRSEPKGIERDPPSAAEHSRIAVVGAGFGGIGLAIQLQNAGIEDFTILERADELGGTWRDNTYPGCACDVASHLYSYSFAPNPDWSRAYSRQEEILGYLRAVASEHGVERYVRYGTELTEAAWNEERSRWELETSRGSMSCDVLIPAMGPFGDAVIPEIPGADTFAGTSFHSLHWDHDHDLAGERVAVIGTGASAVQFIPRIQPEVAELKVFQRTPPWILPRFDRRTTRLERELLRRFPFVRQAIRGCLYTTVESLGLAIWVDRRFATAFEALGRWQLRRQVPDAELRGKLTPDYRIGCKRAILSDDYLPSLQQPNVEVVTDRITEIRERSVLTADGRERPVDTIIYGTGFDVPTRQIARFRGRHGRTLADIYAERPQSYLGTTIAGFPNFFIMLGPFAAGGNQSALYMLESQIAYIVDAVRTINRNGRSVVEVRPEVQNAFVAEMHERSEDTVWLTGGCKSYYTTPDGRNAGLWPNWTFEFRRRTSRFDESDYELRAAA